MSVSVPLSFTASDLTLLLLCLDSNVELFLKKKNFMVHHTPVKDQLIIKCLKMKMYRSTQNARMQCILSVRSLYIAEL